MGFTLAELLIALAILGVIATFTIPKILTASQNGKFNAIAKEDASMISAALEIYSLNNALASGTTVGALTQYMNYVATDTSSTIDAMAGATTSTCAASVPCIRFHNGSMLQYSSTDNLGGTATINAVWLHIDPDGIVTDATTNGPGKAVEFWIYANGRITTRGTLAAGTVYSGGAIAADPTKDPSWFNW